MKRAETRLKKKADKNGKLERAKQEIRETKTRVRARKREKMRRQS